MAKKTGRPTLYTEELADKICTEIALGRGLVSISKEIDVSYQTVMRWLSDHDAFREKYARAREEQADTYADQIAEIADDLTEDPQSRRVRVDARKWIACKLKPKKYGDRQTVEHTGEMTINSLTDEQLSARLAQLLADPAIRGVIGEGDE